MLPLLIKLIISNQIKLNCIMFLIINLLLQWLFYEFKTIKIIYPGVTFKLFIHLAQQNNLHTYPHRLHL